MRENVVFYVTRQYMKKNRKRTLTAFFGIFFMVMLMTCVFVGKETAFDFLERMAVLDRGKWHVAMYDLKPEEAEKVRGISWVKETARSKQTEWRISRRAGMRAGLISISRLMRRRNLTG